MKTLFTELRTSLLMTLCLALVVCGIYPVAVWAVGRLVFPHQANGSLVEIDGHVVGSSLIGQPFKGPTYFHPRPSSAGHGYDAGSSGGSNLGPLSKKLLEQVQGRITRYRQINNLGPNVPIPADAVTSSASGLDPHISVHNALLQAPRVARARGLALDEVRRYVRSFTRDRQYGVLGDPRVNVLLLNLALDGKTGRQ
jgi:potassium-transporting ATPase KdpC subunit